jgi:adenylyltransferase/sulfurtransferase
MKNYTRPINCWDVLLDKEKRRYHRQILLFGEEGQIKLKAARILVAGAGGLGSPVSIYLAAAGVGTLRIVDCDTVEESNLNRQLLHSSRDIYKRKTVSANEKLTVLNPLIRIEPIHRMIEESTVRGIAKDCDLIVDAMDNFETRHLLNQTAIALGIPLIYGSVRGFYGQVMTIIPKKTPCLRCVFPVIPPPKTFPIIGATCGIIGSIQANEALKLLTGLGSPLAGRLFLWNGLAGTTETIRIDHNPDCPTCGTAR